MIHIKKAIFPLHSPCLMFLLLTGMLLGITACKSEPLEDLWPPDAPYTGEFLTAYPDGKRPAPDITRHSPYDLIIESHSFQRPDDPEQKTLYLNIFRPDASGEYPALLMTTAYRREFMRAMPPSPEEMVPHGYAVVHMDARGSGSAEGSWTALSPEEIKDIVYVIEEWIPGASWSNGKIGMYGASYMAIVQFLAAGYNPQHLKAIFPTVSMADAYQDIFMHGGIFEQGFIVPWAMGTMALSLLPSTEIFTDPVRAGEVFREHSDARPDIIAFTENTINGPFFTDRSPMYRWDEAAKLPVFGVGGWWDIFTRGSLLNQTELEKRSKEITGAGGIAGPKRFIIGPWYHISSGNGVPLGKMMKRWFDWHLKLDEEPDYEGYDLLNPKYPVCMYVLGEERWRREKEWPLSRTQYKALYLSGLEQTNERKTLNNGSLLFAETLEEGAALLPQNDYTSIEYDPLQDESKFAGRAARSSCRWIGGAMSFMPYVENEINNDAISLTFSTAPLEEDIEVTGPIALRLWVESVTGPSVDTPPDLWSAYIKGYGIDPVPGKIIAWAKIPDVHWIVNLNDVFPNGRSRNLTSGWLAATHRPDPSRPDWTRAGYDPFNYPEHRNPQPLLEGVPVEYVIEIWPTSNIFKAGHKIRISISNTDYPHLLPSLVPSQSKILHDAEHPSRLIIPVVPEGSTPPHQWIEDIETYLSDSPGAEWIPDLET